MDALRTHAHSSRVSKAIAAAMKEGYDQHQAVAKALAMNRAGRLRNDGSYRHVGEK